MTNTAAPAPEMRRIAIRDAEQRHDLVIPHGNTLAQALAILGTGTGTGIGTGATAGGRVFGPGGTEIDEYTPVSELREGGLYTIAREGARESRGTRESAAASTRLSPWWTALGCALPLALLALTTHTLIAPVALLLILGSLSGVIYAATARRSATPATLDITFFVPPALAALAGALVAPANIYGSGQLAVASAAAGAALSCALTMVIAPSRPRRAAAAALVGILAAIAAVYGISILVGLTLPQTTLILVGCVPPLFRALPSLLFSVDDGYQIDYGRFMTVRWSVRGSVPRYRPTVASEEIRARVAESTARLHALTLVLALIIAVGLPATIIPLAGTPPVERFAALALIICVPLALLLGTRRVSGRDLRTPLRAAALIGLLLTVSLGISILPSTALLITAIVLLLAAGIAAALILPLARNARSVGWSRTADLIESLSLALSPAAALLAAGTLTLMQGAFSG